MWGDHLLSLILLSWAGKSLPSALLGNGNCVSVFNVVVITTYNYFIFLAINVVDITYL